MPDATPARAVPSIPDTAPNVADEVAAEPAGADWDAGDLGCGDLVMLLRTRVLALEPGAVLHVVARDPGAPADMPAWCGLTGHQLVSADHPHYVIRRRPGEPSASPSNQE